MGQRVSRHRKRASHHMGSQVRSVHSSVKARQLYSSYILLPPELSSPGVTSIFSISFVALFWQLVGSLVTGQLGHRGGVSALSTSACTVRRWLKACLGAESSHKCPHLHSVLGHSLLLVKAGLATERLCTTGPHRQQAVGWHSVFWRRTSCHVPP